MTPTTLAAPALPARFGAAFREILATARSVTAEQAAELTWIHGMHTEDTVHDHAAQHHHAARQRVKDALDDIDLTPDAEIFDGLAPSSVDAALAVLARDRGVITQGDFHRLLSPWREVRLPVPQASTGDEGDDVSIMAKTTDRVCDELLHAARHQPDYGAVVLLTGYNFGELLTYEIVRRFISGPPSRPIMCWAKMSSALDHGTGVFAELDDMAVDILRCAIGLAGNLHPVDAANGEVITLATALTVGAEHTINWAWDKPTNPVAVPTARGCEPGE